MTAVGFWPVTFVSMHHLQEFLSSWKHQQKSVGRELEEAISQDSVRSAASLGIIHARPSAASQETSQLWSSVQWRLSQEPMSEESMTFNLPHPLSNILNHS